MSETEFWNPPIDPDPDKILDQARHDARVGRNDVALAKLQWFHHHALEYRPSLSGVRLSFALADWLKLAKAYPPAMDALRFLRDDAEIRCRESNFDLQAFKDLAALNMWLKRQENTIESFKAADRTGSDAAAKIYPTAQRYLAHYKEFSLCGKYLNVKEQLERIEKKYRMENQFADGRADRSSIRDSAHKRFIHSVSLIGALLVRNDRHAEAVQLCDRIQSEHNDDWSRKELQRDLDGVIPPINFPIPSE